MKTSYSELTGIIATEIGWTPPVRYLLRRARILDLIEKEPKGSLLEVGCGAGALLCDFTRLGFSAQGLETSTDAREMGNALAALSSSAHQVCGESSPEWCNAFDILCAFDVLEHIEDDHSALATWLEWLAPRGKLIISVPAHSSRWGEGDVWAGHWRRYDRRDIINLITAIGLEITHIECYGFPLANTTEWLGNHIYRNLMRQRGYRDKSQSTATSGTDRHIYGKAGKYISSFPASTCLRMALAIQYAARRTDWGSGYLIVAARR